MFLHINKFGINEIIRIDEILGVAFVPIPDTVNRSGVYLYRRNNPPLLFDSPQLRANNGNCHELLRDIATQLDCKTVTGTK